MSVQRHFGYLYGQDDTDYIDNNGVEPELVLSLARAAYPNFNPYADPWLNLQYQGNQGACQGHALAHCFSVALTQRYSIQADFSRGGAYYLSQKFDGISGDRGSTLAGGQKVAESGLCLEKEWPYPSRYNPRQPESANGKLNVTMPGSKRVKDPDLAWELLAAGCCIQTGQAWTRAFEKEVCDSYSGGSGGGHSTVLYGLHEETGNAWHHNSWRNWMGDGRNQWTKNFFASILKNDRWAVFVAYDSTNLVIPENFADRVMA